LLGDPGFENGSAITPWTESSTLGFQPITGSTSSEPAHSGSWEAWLNGDGSADTDTVAQSVAIPAGCAAALSYWLHVDTTENTTTATPDTFKVQVLNSAGSVLSTLASYSNLDHNTGYTQIEIFFSIVQKKVVSPNDFASTSQLAATLMAFTHRYNQTAQPFN
jgi:hypothetical protein